MKCLEQKFDQLIKSMKQDATQASQQNNKMLKAITELTVAAGQDQVGKATPYRKQHNARDFQQGNPTGTQPQIQPSIMTNGPDGTNHLQGSAVPKDTRPGQQTNLAKIPISRVGNNKMENRHSEAHGHHADVLMPGAHFCYPGW